MVQTTATGLLGWCGVANETRRAWCWVLNNLKPLVSQSPGTLNYLRHLANYFKPSVSMLQSYVGRYFDRKETAETTESLQNTVY